MISSQMGRCGVLEEVAVDPRWAHRGEVRTVIRRHLAGQSVPEVPVVLKALVDGCAFRTMMGSGVVFTTSRFSAQPAAFKLNGKTHPSSWKGAGSNITAYYRIQGPHLVIEYAPQNDEPTNHVHTIYAIRRMITDVG
jgi:hypothetical protein